MLGYRDMLGRMQGNLAEILKDSGQLDESLNWFNQSIQTLEDAYQQDPRGPAASGALGGFHEGRAQTYHRLKKYSEAVKDFDKAVELGSASWQPIFRASRARSRALNDQVTEAIADVAELSNSGTTDPNGWFNFACVYAVASLKVADKRQEYADRAMELLNKAVAVGYSDTAHLGKDIELDPLREREDFKKLLAELSAKYPPVDPAKADAAQISVNWASVFPHYVDAAQRHREIQGPDHPDTANAIRELAEAQAKLTEYIAAQRKEFPADNPVFASFLAQASDGLLRCDQYAAAEEMLRECVAIREKTQPNDWTTFNTISMLGGSLLRQAKYADAEPLLLRGYEGMQQRQSTIHPADKERVRQALQRLVELYTATENPEQAAEWQKKLDEFKAAASADNPPPSDQAKRP